MTTRGAGKDAVRERQLTTYKAAGSEKLDHSYIVGGNVKWCDHSENNLSFSYKANMQLPFDQAIALLGK